MRCGYSWDEATLDAIDLSKPLSEGKAPTVEEKLEGIWVDCEMCLDGKHESCEMGATAGEVKCKCSCWEAEEDGAKLIRQLDKFNEAPGRPSIFDELPRMWEQIKNARKGVYTRFNRIHIAMWVDDHHE